VTTRAEFTGEEWERLTDLPKLAALAAMAAEQSGAVTSTRELWGAIAEMARARQNAYRENELIQDVLAAITAGDDSTGLEMSLANTGSEAVISEAVRQSLELAREVDVALTTRATPEEAVQYRAWIVAIARAGSEAARGGLFGLRGEMVTPAEERYVTDLAAALGMS
jgi:hypothetical protein